MILRDRESSMNDVTSLWVGKWNDFVTRGTRAFLIKDNRIKNYPKLGDVTDGRPPFPVKNGVSVNDSR